MIPSSEASTIHEIYSKTNWPQPKRNCKVTMGFIRSGGFRDRTTKDHAESGVRAKLQRGKSDVDARYSAKKGRGPRVNTTTSRK